MVSMSSIYMYIDGVYGCYIHVYLLYMSVMYMYIDCVYECYVHVY